MNATTKEHRIFFSYALHDYAWVKAFEDALEGEGISVFNPENLASAFPKVEALEIKLKQGDTQVIFFSPESIDNSNLLFELGAAVGSHKAVIPVLIGNVDAKRIPLSLTNKQWVQATTPQETAERVAEIIQQDI